MFLHGHPLCCMREVVNSQILRRFYDRPWLLLSLCALFWAGNAVAGKLAVGEISPMTLTVLRWTGACCVLWVIGRHSLIRDLAVARKGLPFLFFLGGLGFTGFNGFLYLAAETTNGINLLIIQGAIPVMILVCSAVFQKQRVAVLQVLGIALTLLGVIVTATEGHPDRLMMLAFNQGDVLMLLAAACYAAYAMLLKRKPVMPALALLFALCVGAAGFAMLGLAVEILRGRAYLPGPVGWLIVVYCIAFPSLLSQLFFIRGVELIGPLRAGLSVNLIPVFGAVLMVFAGQPFLWSHAAAMALVLSGVMMAERFRPLAASR
jgi:drug/metabolite transporter (DMT)-like permease